MNEFEQRLRRQPLKEIPPAWRAEILVAADVNRRNVRAFTSAATGAATGAATIRARVRAIFWPAPAAWAGLAAVWVFILAVNVSLGEPAPRRAEKAAPPSPEVIVELRKQQILLAELIGPREECVADRSKTYVPGPRGERMELVAV